MIHFSKLTLSSMLRSRCTSRWLRKIAKQGPSIKPTQLTPTRPGLSIKSRRVRPSRICNTWKNRRINRCNSVLMLNKVNRIYSSRISTSTQLNWQQTKGHSPNVLLTILIGKTRLQGLNYSLMKRWSTTSRIKHKNKGWIRGKTLDKSQAKNKLIKARFKSIQRTARDLENAISRKRASLTRSWKASWSHA